MRFPVTGPGAAESGLALTGFGYLHPMDRNGSNGQGWTHMNATAGRTTERPIFDDMVTLPTQTGRRTGTLPSQRTGTTPERTWAGSAVPVRTTVLVADPQLFTRQTLTAQLSSGGVGQVIEADTVAGVQEVIRGGAGGQVALVSMGFGDGSIRLIHDLREAGWQRVIALAPTTDAEPVIAAIHAGASGILRGHPTAPPSEANREIKGLSDREIEILTLVADGRSNKWIADLLTLSPLTVKSHLARISRKLGTGDRSHLVAIAMRAGLIS